MERSCAYGELTADITIRLAVGSPGDPGYRVSRWHHIGAQVGIPSDPLILPGRVNSQIAADSITQSRNGVFHVQLANIARWCRLGGRPGGTSGLGSVTGTLNNVTGKLPDNNSISNDLGQGNSSQGS